MSDEVAHAPVICSSIVMSVEALSTNFHFHVGGICLQPHRDRANGVDPGMPFDGGQGQGMLYAEGIIK